jgi:hypothetical protein
VVIFPLWIGTMMLSNPPHVWAALVVCSDQTCQTKKEKTVLALPDKKRKSMLIFNCETEDLEMDDVAKMQKSMAENETTFVGFDS